MARRAYTTTDGTVSSTHFEDVEDAIDEAENLIRRLPDITHVWVRDDDFKVVFEEWKTANGIIKNDNVGMGDYLLHEEG
jgi:hypothetical protein